MTKIVTPVAAPAQNMKITLQDKVMMLGSCFTDEIGRRMEDAGFDICANPFGTLYNPASILYSLRRLAGTGFFGPEDCVEIGAGDGRICSFSHHTSFARSSEGEFLENANAQLESARNFWKDCTALVITLGTAYVWEHRTAGIVSNCLKRDAGEFDHRMLDILECGNSLREILELAKGKKVIFTVSPIRHMAQGAHQNTLSKATLHLAVQQALGGCADALSAYFPAYEILCDELRDYRYYSDDLVHPSRLAVDIIWERFAGCFVPTEQHAAMAANEKCAKRRLHRPLSDEK